MSLRVDQNYGLDVEQLDDSLPEEYRLRTDSYGLTLFYSDEGLELPIVTDNGNLSNQAIVLIDEMGIAPGKTK